MIDTLGILTQFSYLSFCFTLILMLFLAQ